MASEMKERSAKGFEGAPSGASVEKGDEEVILLWPSRVKLLFNAHVWFSVIWGFGAACLFLALIFGLVWGSASAGLIIGGGGFAFFLAVFLVTGVFVDLFGGFRVTFMLTNRGIRSVRGKGGNAVSTVATIGGILAGSAATVGAGLLSESERNVFIPYPHVTKVKVRSSGKYILVRGGSKPIGLYCRVEDSGRILDLLKQRCPSAKFL